MAAILSRTQCVKFEYDNPVTTYLPYIVLLMTERYSMTTSSNIRYYINVLFMRQWQFINLSWIKWYLVRRNTHCYCHSIQWCPIQHVQRPSFCILLYCVFFEITDIQITFFSGERLQQKKEPVRKETLVDGWIFYRQNCYLATRVKCASWIVHFHKLCRFCMGNEIHTGNYGPRMHYYDIFSK